MIPGARDVTLRTADGLSLGAWHVPRAVSDGRSTVLVANGNAGDRSVRAPLAAALATGDWPCCSSTTAGSAATPAARPSRAWR